MKKLIYFLLSLYILNINPSLATSGQERGNGGQTVYVGENAFLRDIVEANNCIWHSSTLVKRRYPKVLEVLKSIETVHWMTTLRLEDEFNKMNFCFTKKRLPPLSYNNTDDLYIFTNQLFDQPAINDGGIVFINTELFNDMTEVHQAFLFLHEISHEFFDKKEAREFREPRLRQFILNSHEHFLDPIDKDSFKINLIMTKFVSLKIDIDDLDEREFKAILNGTVVDINEKSRLFFKYRRFAENLKATDISRSSSVSSNWRNNTYSLETPQENIFIERFVENLKSFRVEVRIHLLDLLGRREISKLNKISTKETYAYFKGNFDDNLNEIISNEDMSAQVVEYQELFESIGYDLIHSNLSRILIRDFENGYVDSDSDLILNNSLSLMKESSFKLLIKEQYSFLFANKIVNLDFARNFLDRYSLNNFTKNLVKQNVLKLYKEVGSYSFFNNILNEQEIIETLISNYNNLIDISNLSHEATLNMFYELDQRDRLSFLVRKGMDIYLNDASKLNVLFLFDETLIDFSKFEISPFYTVKLDVLKIVSKFSTYKAEVDTIKFLSYFFKYDIKTKRRRRRSTEIDSYILINKVAVYERIKLYSEGFDRSSKKQFKKDLKKVLASLVLIEILDLKDPGKFSTFKSKLKREVLNLL